MEPENNIPTLETSTSERFAELWQGFNHNQRRYVTARLRFATKTEAAKSVDMKPDTVYRWPKEVEEAVVIATSGLVDAVRGVLENASLEAALVKVDGLTSSDDRLKQSIATEIIEWVIGKATQRNEISGKIKVDYSNLTDAQLERIIAGESPESVTTRTG